MSAEQLFFPTTDRVVGEIRGLLARLRMVTFREVLLLARKDNNSSQSKGVLSSLSLRDSKQTEEYSMRERHVVRWLDLRPI